MEERPGLYSLDIGFDREALPRPDSEPDEPIYPLQYGITIAGDRSSNPVAQARNLKKGGRIRFTLYDLTSYAEQRLTSPVQWLSFRITFYRARRSTRSRSPLIAPVLKDFSIHPDLDSPIKSTVFTGLGSHRVFPNWNVFSPVDSHDPHFVEFPENQLSPEPVPRPAGIPLIHQGYFYFNMELWLGWQDEGLAPGSIRRYKTDPEMILSGDG